SANGCVGIGYRRRFQQQVAELLKDAVPNVTRAAILCTAAWLEGTNSVCGEWASDCRSAPWAFQPLITGALRQLSNPPRYPTAARCRLPRRARAGRQALLRNAHHRRR